MRLIYGKYYLYEHKTVYDKVKKGPKKVSGGILGSITENDGFIPSPKRALKTTVFQESYQGIQCKEFGVPSLITSVFTTYSKALDKIFDEDWKNILAIDYCRFVYRCPLKSIPFRLASSFLPELLNLLPFNDKQAFGI